MNNFRKFKVCLLMVIFFLCLSLGNCAAASGIILNDLQGERVDISSYQGKPVILFFWTTWCPYCRQELKQLNQQSAVMAQEGIVVFGVNVNEPDYKVQRFLKDYRLSFRTLLDQKALLADKYDLVGVPTYVFLDRNGQVILKDHNLPANYKKLLFK